MSSLRNIDRRDLVPSSISQVRTNVKFELLNYFRARRFYVLLAITLMISALLTGVVGYYRPASYLSSQLGFYASWWGTWVTFVIVLSGIFFGGDAISGEFQNKTGYFLIPNPIRRSTIYVGKWIAAFAASSLVLAIYAATTLANGIYYFGAIIPSQFGESIVFALLYLVAVLGFTFFFSSLFKNSSLSILITAILFLFVFNLIQNLVAGLVQIEPWFLLTYGSQVIGNVLADPYPPSVSTRSFGPGATNLTSYNASIPEGLVIIAVYFIVTAILGLILFERKEFT